jgi:hypothetical protein
VYDDNKGDEAGIETSRRGGLMGYPDYEDGVTTQSKVAQGGKMNIIKWLSIGAVGVVGFLVIGVISLAYIGSQMEPSSAGAKPTSQGNPLKKEVHLKEAAQKEDHNVEKADQKPAQKQEEVKDPSPNKTSSTKDPVQYSNDQNLAEAPVDTVTSAAEAYYQAVEAEDWGYTYDHLDAETQGAYTEDEWFNINGWGASNYPATFSVQDVVMDPTSPSTLSDVTVLLTSPEDGSTSVRNTFFVYEDGMWKHRFSAQDYDILAGAQAASASASATSAPPDPVDSSGSEAGTSSSVGEGQVAVEVVVEASEPVDVSIFDDDFSTSINEQVTSERYTLTLDEDSGLSASASTEGMMDGDVSIKVYEDGTLVHEDEAEGMALVQY